MIDEHAAWIAHLEGNAPLPASAKTAASHALQMRAAVFGLGSLPPAPDPREADPWCITASILRSFALDEDLAHHSLGTTRDPALRIEVMVARCLVSLARSDLVAATEAARQATRAAYTEAIRWQEYLAYWALCRVRRRSGMAFSAARIAGALARAAPEPWWRLIDWELVLGGGDEHAAGRPLTAPAADWLALCRAAVEGRRADSDAARARLQSAALPARFARERDLLCQGLDDLDPSNVLSDLDAVQAVSGPLQEAAEQLGRTPAVWHVRAGGRPVLRWCVAPALLAGDTPACAFEDGERVQTAIAALVASGVLAEAELFRAVYQFAYDPSVHDGLLRVLLHRVRATLDGVATVARDGDRLRLVAETSFVCPEPRSAPPFGDRLLRLVALVPGTTARALADRLGTSVRSVQRALRTLGESGACRSVKEGRTLRFEVEDTTFSEPTDFPHPGRPDPA